MIPYNLMAIMNTHTAHNEEYGKPKAVGLLSGGLDSALAAKIVSDLGVEVYGLNFSLPWGCCNKDKAAQIAQRLGIKFMVMQLDERYLELIKNPKHGYGNALNPCVDCRLHMFERARQFMESIGGDFVFTGEVLGQRPMSQMKQSMATIEKKSGLTGRLLRPLSAQLLDPTIPEQEGLIDRKKLLDLSGRSRKPQIALAREMGIDEYLAPAGGCLLTDKNFANRMKDTFLYGYRTFRETISLKWGRHFRISDKFKVIIGRDENENESLMRYAHHDDYILQIENKAGPVAILKGSEPDEATLGIAAGLVQRYSKFRSEPAMDVLYWPAHDERNTRSIRAIMRPDDHTIAMKI